MFGKEFSCAALNKAPSVKPAVKEVPIEMYLEKSKPSVFNATSAAASEGIASNSLLTSQETMLNDKRNNPKYLYVFIKCFIFLLVINCPRKVVLRTNCSNSWST